MARNDNEPGQRPNPNPWVVRIVVFVILTVFAFFVWNTAWAQSSDWVDPATDSLAMVSGRINWQWVIAILVGGVLVFLGGTAVRELLGP